MNRTRHAFDRDMGCPRLLALMGCVLLSLSSFQHRPLLVWNASASAPIGLYLVSNPRTVGRGDTVIARLPQDWRSFAAARGYIREGVPLVKQVVGVSGDTICARGQRILINTRPVAHRLSADAQGRPLLGWRGCRNLKQGEVFLLMADKAQSFDGRYFGPTALADIIGRAHLLWAYSLNSTAT